MIGRKIGRGVGRTLIYIFLIVIALVTLFPIIYTFLASFKTNSEIMTDGIKMWPDVWHTENYAKAWHDVNFGRMTFNSVYLAFFEVIGVLITSSMSGYVFSRGQFKLKGVIFGIFVSTMFISLGSATLYATLQVAKFLHINRGLNGIIIISCLGLHMTDLYLVRGFINGLSHEIDEAAKIDGCSFFRIYWNIMLPLLKPILATITILTFKSAWNSYLMPLIFTLGTPEWHPLIVGVTSLKNSGESATNWAYMLAGTMISIIPMVLIYLVLNKQFVESVAAGAVKG